MKRIVSVYFSQKRVIAFTDNHLYEFPLKDAFWNRLAESPDRVFVKAMDEITTLSKNFSLHADGRPEREETPLLVISLPLPFFALLFRCALEDKVPARYSSLLSSVLGCATYVVAKKMQGSMGNAIVAHTEHALTSFALLSASGTVEFFPVKAEQAGRYLLRLRQQLPKHGKITIALSGSSNPMLVSMLQTVAAEGNEIVEVSDEEIVRGIYFLAIAHAQQTQKSSTTGKRKHVDIGEEE